jgi:hypothetical protein
MVTEDNPDSRPEMTRMMSTGYHGHVHTSRALYEEVKAQLHTILLDYDARASGLDLLRRRVVAWLLVFSGKRYLLSPDPLTCPTRLLFFC